MAVLPLVIAPDPRLEVCSESVQEIDQDICTLIQDMLDTMYNKSGLGLAAVQVGVHKRILVTEIPQHNERYDLENLYNGKPMDYIGKGGPFIIINPEIIEESLETISLREGCLSIPGQYDDIVRPCYITVRYLNQHGKEQILQAKDWLARCILHEIDHLNGKLFIDKLSKLKYHMALNKAKKTKSKLHIT